MTELYIVKAGEYADEHVVEIFDNEEEAEQFVQQYNQCIRDFRRFDEAFIEEGTMRLRSKSPDARQYFNRMELEVRATELAEEGGDDETIEWIRNGI